MSIDRCKEYGDKKWKGVSFTEKNENSKNNYIEMTGEELSAAFKEAKEKNRMVVIQRQSGREISGHIEKAAKEGVYINGILVPYYSITSIKVNK